MNYVLFIVGYQWSEVEFNWDPEAGAYTIDDDNAQFLGNFDLDGISTRRETTHYSTGFVRNFTLF